MRNFKIFTEKHEFGAWTKLSYVQNLSRMLPFTMKNSNISVGGGEGGIPPDHLKEVFRILSTGKPNPVAMSFYLF